MSPANPTARFLNFTHPIPRRMSEIGCSGIVEPRSESSNTWYRISICLPQGKHKVQLERASGTIYFLFFFFRYRSRHEIKETSPQGPCLDSISGAVCREDDVGVAWHMWPIAFHLPPLPKSNNEHGIRGRVWERYTPRSRGASV